MSEQATSTVDFETSVLACKQDEEYCVISHTHWDREWYLPFEVFRVRLMDLIDRLLEIFEDDPNYIFHLDAQTIVLEDYLQIRPSRRGVLEKLIRERRLLVGPWYVQNDFYLTSGEATVRNLLIGSQIAHQFGSCSRVGYVPDQFGLISQLPQILNGFGMDNCVFGRGCQDMPGGEDHQPPLPNEFIWRGQDGSSVFSVRMSDWYNNAQRFSPDLRKSANYLRHIRSVLRPLSKTPYLLLMNGVDHLEAQEDLAPILRALDKQLEGATIYQTTLEAYLEKVSHYLKPTQMREHCGELRRGYDVHILQGTLSSRAYLKRENVRAQTLLENKIEPLYAMSALLGLPEQYPHDFLLYLWKETISNHAHDSICGCSRDAVHAHMEDRLARVQECGGELVNRGLKFLSDRIDRALCGQADYLITVVNTLKDARSRLVRAALAFPASEQVGCFELLDPSGERVPFEIVRKAPGKISLLSPINLPGQIDVEEYEIRFEARDLPGMGYGVYRLCTSDEPWDEAAFVSPAAPEPVAQPVTLENGNLALRVDPQGRLDLLDKRSGVWTRDIIDLLDEADVGNAYNFVPAPSVEPVLVSKAFAPRVELLEDTPLSKAVRLVWDAPLPKGYDFAQGQRSPATVLNRIELTARLEQGSACLGLEVEVDNRSRDHRLQLLVHTGIDTDESTSAQPFDFTRRNRRDAWLSVRQDSSQPNSGLVWVEGGGRSLTLLNEGLFSYAHLCDERHSLALTLVRATGVIVSEDPLKPTPVEWRAPANQCLRCERFRIGLRPGGAPEKDPHSLLQNFLVEPLVFFDAVDEKKFAGGRPCVQNSELTEIFYREIPSRQRHLPLRAQALRIEGEAVALSALKRSQDQQMWVVRVWNTSGQPQNVRVHLPFEARRVEALRLDEARLETLAQQARTVELSLAPKQIMTLGFD